MLKQYFPAALSAINTNNLIRAIIFYLIIGIVGGVICRLVGIIPIIGWLVAGILGLIVGLYVLFGLILSVLTFVTVNKKH